MGQVQSQIDPRHVGIYKKILAIQNPQTRLQMIDTIFSDPSIIHSAKVAGVYGVLLQYSAAIRHGHPVPNLPGEVSQSQAYQSQAYQSQANGNVLPPPIIQQRPSSQAYQSQAYQSQAYQSQTNQMISYEQRSLYGVQTKPAPTPVQRVTKPKQSEKALSFFTACLNVLGIEEEVALTEQSLKVAYKRAVVKAHPDKGGSKEAFDAVTRAYAYLLDILKLVQGQKTKVSGAETALPSVESVQQGRQTASQSWQMPEEPVRLNPKNLNMKVFNEMFEQTRIPDPDEDGYGDWLKNETESNGKRKKLGKKFSENFNREVFNSIFEEEQSASNSTQIINYQNPQELMLAPSYGVELGRDRPPDFTAAPNSDLQFTDLRSAYTKENTVSNQIQGIRVENRDFNSYKAQREKAPAQYNQQELAALAAYEAQQKKREEQRQIRAAQEHIIANDYFERMKRLVITDK